MSGRDHGRRSPCDASGLCEEVDKICRGDAPPERCVAAGEGWAILVDIAPLALGHSLFTHFEHVPRSGLLTEATFLARAAVLDRVAASIELAGMQPTMIEHGSGDQPGRGDCVRHPHVHIAALPMRPLPDVIPALSPMLRIVEVVPTWADLHSVISVMDEYVVVRLGKEFLIGVMPKVPQISRSVLAMLAGRDMNEVDWMLGVRNELYDPSIQIAKAMATQATPDV